MTFRQAHKGILDMGYRIQAQTCHGPGVSYDACDMKTRLRGRLVYGPTGTSQEAMVGLWRLCQLREIRERLLDAHSV